MTALNQTVLQDIKKILWGCSFGCKNLLNSTCLTVKFNNYHHANIHLFENIFSGKKVFKKLVTLHPIFQATKSHFSMYGPGESFYLECHKGKGDLSTPLSLSDWCTVRQHMSCMCLSTSPFTFGLLVKLTGNCRFLSFLHKFKGNLPPKWCENFTFFMVTHLHKKGGKNVCKYPQ